VNRQANKDIKMTRSPISAARIAAALAVFGAALGPQQALALEQITVPASACEVRGPRWTGSLIPPLTRFAGYLSGNNPWTTEVVCPLPRYSDGGPVEIHVDGRVSAQGWIECAVEGRNYNGVATGGVPFTIFGNGAVRTFDQLVALTDSQAPHWAYLTLICTLASPSERLFGVTVTR
jgi:hypothetical protein